MVKHTMRMTLTGTGRSFRIPLPCGHRTALLPVGKDWTVRHCPECHRHWLVKCGARTAEVTDITCATCGGELDAEGDLWHCRHCGDEFSDDDGKGSEVSEGRRMLLVEMRTCGSCLGTVILWDGDFRHIVPGCPSSPPQPLAEDACGPLCWTAVPCPGCGQSLPPRGRAMPSEMCILDCCDEARMDPAVNPRHMWSEEEASQ